MGRRDDDSKAKAKPSWAKFVRIGLARMQRAAAARHVREQGPARSRTARCRRYDLDDLLYPEAGCAPSATPPAGWS
eukprot:scaffold47547_cov34-Tisochrysis_lutea.AAC.3